MSRIQWEWKVNLTHVLTALTFVVSGLTAFFDLKSDARDIKSRAETKYTEYDKKWEAQRLLDDGQDTRQARAFTQMTDAIRDLKSDMRSDLKDLRNDLSRPITRSYATPSYPSSIPAPRVPAPREQERGG